MTKQSPSYQKIVEILKQEIRDGQYERLPSVASLTSRFQVGAYSVKKALEMLKEQGIVTRIPRRGTLVTINSLQSSQTLAGNIATDKTIGVIFPSLDRFTQRILNGILDTVQSHDIQVVVGLSRNTHHGETSQLKRLTQIPVDGMIVFPAEGEAYNEELLRLTIGKFPLVLVDRWLEGVTAPYVAANHWNGAYDAAKYLTALGHRRIVGVSLNSPHSWHTQSLVERFRGIHDGLVDSQIIPDPTLIWTNDRQTSDWLPVADEIAMFEERVRNRGNITAFIGLSTVDTFIIMQGLENLGYRVPQDMSVVGFDTWDLTECTESFPSISQRCLQITSVCQNEVLLGKNAANVLIRLINRQSVELKTIIATRLMMGITSTCPPDSHLESFA